MSGLIKPDGTPLVAAERSSRPTARYMRDTKSGVIASRAAPLTSHRDDVRRSWSRAAGLAMDLIQTSGLSTISLRRLGDDRTLVLINGMRAVCVPGLTQAAAPQAAGAADVGMPDMGGADVPALGMTTMDMPDMDMPAMGGMDDLGGIDDLPALDGGLPDMGGDLPDLGGDLPDLGGDLPDLGGGGLPDLEPMGDLGMGLDAEPGDLGDLDDLGGLDDLDDLIQLSDDDIGDPVALADLDLTGS